jgi:phosphatidylinositol glycan class Q protein
VGKLYALMLDVLSSLFRLFMGRKNNVLKKRIDTGEFGVDELLLGTLIFTGLIFLYPTIAMYYLCFVSIWLLIQCAQALLSVSLTIVNEFPIFLIWSYFARPGLFTDGIYFEIRSSSQSTSYLKLMNKTKPLSEVLAGVTNKVTENLQEFSPGRLLKRAFLGHPIPHFTKAKRLT